MRPGVEWNSESSGEMIGYPLSKTGHALREEGAAYFPSFVSHINARQS